MKLLLQSTPPPPAPPLIKKNDSADAPTFQIQWNVPRRWTSTVKETSSRATPIESIIQSIITGGSLKCFVKPRHLFHLQSILWRFSCLLKQDSLAAWQLLFPLHHLRPMIAVGKSWQKKKRSLHGCVLIFDGGHESEKRLRNLLIDWLNSAVNVVNELLER